MSCLGTRLMGVPCASQSRCLEERAAQSGEQILLLALATHPWPLRQLLLCPCAPPEPEPTDSCCRGSAPGWGPSTLLLRRRPLHLFKRSA